jgi:hypothetical protein
VYRRCGNIHGHRSRRAPWCGGDFFREISLTMSKPRISYVDSSTVDDAAAASTDASMAPGFETFDVLKRPKQVEDYRAEVNSEPARQAAE